MNYGCSFFAGIAWPRRGHTNANSFQGRSGPIIAISRKLQKFPPNLGLLAIKCDALIG